MVNLCMQWVLLLFARQSGVQETACCEDKRVKSLRARSVSSFQSSFQICFLIQIKPTVPAGFFPGTHSLLNERDLIEITGYDLFFPRLFGRFAEVCAAEVDGAGIKKLEDDGAALPQSSHEGRKYG